ncbi:hypothetical protein [Streptococcus equi]|uniref:hypothetical protein n=1 Tax=Streptococcus equi TaxID=1336 RepID=UPI001E4E2ED6|nr:hypothetical protein [Streptococcus equi]MCD3456216.1 hypothetical protein [Streptococcus equi subsp. zooepidemicus]
MPSKALTDKIIQWLLNKGFSYDLAKGVVSQLSLEQDSQYIEDLLDQEFDKLLRKYSRRYEMHKQEMHYSPNLDFILKENVKLLVDWINKEKGPFSKAYVSIWYKRYLELKNR